MIPRDIVYDHVRAHGYNPEDVYYISRAHQEFLTELYEGTDSTNNAAYWAAWLSALSDFELNYSTSVDEEIEPEHVEDSTTELLRYWSSHHARLMRIVERAFVPSSARTPVQVLGRYDLFSA